MSKLTLHCQQIPGFVGSFLDMANAEYVKIIDPPEQNPFPGKKVIARFFMNDADSNALVWQGADGADQWFDWVYPAIAARPYIYATESGNEPQPMWEPAFVVALGEYTTRLSTLMYNAGLKLVGMNWSVGWPYLQYFNDPSPTVVELGPAIQHLADHGHYLGLHEYSAPAMWDNEGAYCLRYRNTVNELAALGFDVPNVLVTECGIDGGVINQPKTGWKTFTNEQGYIDQLLWYEQRLRENSYVKAATVFTAGPFQDWLDFEVTESLAMNLANELANMPQQERAKGIDVSQYQKNIDWQQVKDSGIEFVMIRSSSGRVPPDMEPGLHKDTKFEQNWAGAGDVGLLRGVYHYLAPGKGQAEFWKECVGDKEPELGFWIDVEDGGVGANKVVGFTGYAEQALGATVGYYTRANIWDGLNVDPDDRLLWVAHWLYDPELEPTLPNEWSEWEFWQYSNAGDVPGIVGNVDMDVFNGTVQELQNKYGTPEPPPQDIKYFWYDGSEVDEQTFKAEFGKFVIEQGGEYHVTELHAAQGYATFRFRVLDENGNPATDEQVVYSWPDAPALPGGGWDGKGIVHPVDADGWAEHGMGQGEYYYPDQGQVGPASAWIYGEGKSDCQRGIGMIGGTDHHHFDVVMQKGSVAPVMHTLYVWVEGQGTVDVNPPGDEFEHGTTVVLTAIPADGWKFVGWSGNLSGNDNPTSLLMDDMKQVTALFEEEAGNGIEQAILLIESAQADLDAALVILEGMQ